MRLNSTLLPRQSYFRSETEWITRGHATNIILRATERIEHERGRGIHAAICLFTKSTRNLIIARIIGHRCHGNRTNGRDEFDIPTRSFRTSPVHS